MDPRDFHKLAIRLAGGSSAADCRTAIGRAYYAVFNVGAQHLRNLGFKVRKGPGAHGEVQLCLANSGDADVMRAASDIGLLHSRRNKADYQLDHRDVEDPAVVRTVVDSAGQRIVTLDTAFTGPRRAVIHAAITKWRRENGYP